MVLDFTQGSAEGATLGWMMESFQDSECAHPDVKRTGDVVNQIEYLRRRFEVMARRLQPPMLATAGRWRIFLLVPDRFYYT